MSTTEENLQRHWRRRILAPWDEAPEPQGERPLPPEQEALLSRHAQLLQELPGGEALPFSVEGVDLEPPPDLLPRLLAISEVHQTPWGARIRAWLDGVSERLSSPRLAMVLTPALALLLWALLPSTPLDPPLGEILKGSVDPRSLPSLMEIHMVHQRGRLREMKLLDITRLSNGELGVEWGRDMVVVPVLESLTLGQAGKLHGVLILEGTTGASRQIVDRSGPDESPAPVPRQAGLFAWGHAVRLPVGQAAGIYRVHILLTQQPLSPDEESRLMEKPSDQADARRLPTLGIKGAFEGSIRVEVP